MSDANDRDEYLMARVARGQPEFLEKLIRRHASPLLTFIARMVGDLHRGEELFQEVFLTVWKHRRRYDYPRPFKPWLYAIAVNKCRETFRQRTLSPVSLSHGEQASPLTAEAQPDESAMASETAALVSQAVTRLPAQQRAVVVLRIWEGLPYARIAEALDRSEATVRSHMHHALIALRQSLGPLLGDREPASPSRPE
jgi:RNA polymerase sigma-70 factor (ECF subfamily)